MGKDEKQHGCEASRYAVDCHSVALTGKPSKEEVWSRWGRLSKVKDTSRKS
jgi:hypothetical protein